MKLFYNDLHPNLGNTPQWNGNISTQTWQTLSSTANTHGIAYSYDTLNRLTAANYGNSANWASQAYDESNISYCNNGNILSFKRNNALGVAMDDMQYKYFGNQLISITDNGTSQGFNRIDNPGKLYTYDANGNLKDKKISATQTFTFNYNHLNLPNVISYTSTNKIVYVYTATGQKLVKQVQESNVVKSQSYYLGMFEYDLSLALKHILMEEGRIIPQTNTTFQWEYYLKDHLGNTRIAFCDKDNNRAINTANEVTQETHYYSYGLAMTGIGSSASTNKYLYNGKELQTGEFTGASLDLYDYGARMYDATVGRWWVIDNKAEKYFNWSPYTYCINNPLIYIDPTGEIVEHASLKDWLNTLWGRVSNKQFRQDFNTLKASKETYVFKGSKLKDGYMGDKSQKEGGNTTTDGNKIFINYGYGKPMENSGNTNLSALYHETTHGVEFEDGKFGFVKTGGEWQVFNGDIYDEYEAFNSEYKNSNDYYKTPSGYKNDLTNEPTSAFIFKVGTVAQRLQQIEQQYTDLPTGGQYVNDATTRKKNNSEYYRPYNQNSPNPANAKIIKKGHGLLLPVNNNNSWQW